MASRPVIIASLLGASVGVPYIASRATTGPHPTGGPATAISATAAQPMTMNRTAPMPTAYAAPAMTTLAPSYPASTPVAEGAQFTSVAQVLRFDVTKEWVCRNWPRKSDGPTDVGLFSMRVPLVMGTQMTSLAGSLTYYFNLQGQVEHISF
ncbi:MAG TPA: DUF6690 family protein, partial [Lacipirellulaceae bacterium]|nr:DUF6690 family protein [Lacipirellulaceae bacterium]